MPLFVIFFTSFSSHLQLVIPIVFSHFQNFFGVFHSGNPTCPSQPFKYCSARKVLKGRKYNGTYLANIRRHRWSVKMTMKKNIKWSFQPAQWLSSAEEEVFLHFIFFFIIIFTVQQCLQIEAR